MSKFIPTEEQVREAMMLNPGLEYDFVEAALESLNESIAGKLTPRKFAHYETENGTKKRVALLAE